MNKPIIYAWLLLFCALSWPRLAGAAPDERFLLFYDPEWEFTSSLRAVHALTPLCAEISRQTGLTLRPRYLRREQDLADNLTNPDVALIILNSQVARNYRLVTEPLLLLRPVREKSGQSPPPAKILLRRPVDNQPCDETAVRTLALLPHEKKLFENVRTELQERNPCFSFNRILIAPSESSLMLLLELGLADGLIIDAGREKALLQHAPGLQKIHTFAAHPNSAILLGGKGLPREAVDGARAALLALNDSPGGREILDSLGVETFEDITPEYTTPELIASESLSTDAGGSESASPDFGSSDSVISESASPDFGSPDFGSPDFGSPESVTPAAAAPPQASAGPENSGRIKNVSVRFEQALSAYTITVLLEDQGGEDAPPPRIRYTRPDGTPAEMIMRRSAANRFSATIPAVAPLSDQGSDEYVAHVVKAGECLSQIADVYLGDPSQYARLATLNDIAQPDHLPAGRTIKVPVPGKWPLDQISYEILVSD